MNISILTGMYEPPFPFPSGVERFVAEEVLMKMDEIDESRKGDETPDYNFMVQFHPADNIRCLKTPSPGFYSPADYDPVSSPELACTETLGDETDDGDMDDDWSDCAEFHYTDHIPDLAESFFAKYE